MPVSHRLFALSLTVACAAGCSTPPAETAPAPIAIADLTGTLATRFCRSPFTQALLPVVPTGGQCIAEYYSYHSWLLPGRIQLAEAGRLHYDPVAAATCLRDTAPDRFWYVDTVLQMFRVRWPDVDVPAACANVFTGSKATGQPCDDDAECASGRCWGCPTGVCVQPVARGEACGRSHACGPDDICANGVCTPLRVDLPAGASCDMAVNQNPVANVVYSDFISTPALGCAPNLACVGDGIAATGTCQAMRPAGSACASSSECSGTLVCHDQKCQDASVVWPPVHCGAVTCKAGEACATSLATPTCLPAALPGEACDPTVACTPGTCGADHRCTDGRKCSGACPLDLCAADGQCHVPRLGAACSSAKDCANPSDVYGWPGLTCDGGVCRRYMETACSFPAGS